MQLRNVDGTLIFKLDAAKSILDLVVAAVAANKSLRGADLRGADLYGADLRGADLRGADLYGADLREADLRGANLRGADLRVADLRGANLDSANLRGADLRVANLRVANLDSANLREADLRGANLDSANLREAKLYGKKIIHMRLFTGLYLYAVQSVLFKDGSRWIRMGCLFKSLEDWEMIGIRKSNLSEFPDDGSDRCENRAAAFEFAKAAVLRMKMPELEKK